MSRYFTIKQEQPDWFEADVEITIDGYDFDDLKANASEDIETFDPSETDWYHNYGDEITFSFTFEVRRSLLEHLSDDVPVHDQEEYELDVDSLVVHDVNTKYNGVVLEGRANVRRL